MSDFVKLSEQQKASSLKPSSSANKDFGASSSTDENFSWNAPNFQENTPELVVHFGKIILGMIFTTYSEPIFWAVPALARFLRKRPHIPQVPGPKLGYVRICLCDA